ncbi:Fur family transcriptional regulator [Parapedobacter deserti]|uniref:Fur family transcriptional regulator n=1 Tax=Parapedobacter deserti TaxID=1912957 RepID=A0ABV7JH19_9SPHI
MDGKQLANILEARSVKPTAMRLLVLDTLIRQEAAVSLSDLEGRFDKVDKVTLYRTLKTFEQHKIIHSIDDGTGSAKYALCSEGCECSPGDLHVHFHCQQCKRTFCLTDYAIPAVNLSEKFVLKEINMVLKGFCDACSD